MVEREGWLGWMEASGKNDSGQTDGVRIGAVVEDIVEGEFVLRLPHSRSIGAQFTEFC